MVVKVKAYDVTKIRKHNRENSNLVEFPFDESPPVDGTVLDPLPAIVGH